LTNQITFSLRRIPFHIIIDHLKKNSNTNLQSHKCPNLLKYEWIYLSDFYAPQTAPYGLATKTLKYALKQITYGNIINNAPYILCCEPILGTDSRAITKKTEHLLAEDRYKKLCKYYEKEFSLCNHIRTQCTIKTEIRGIGKKWSDLDRKLLWGIIA
jgi:hypothetical protein